MYCVYHGSRPVKRRLSEAWRYAVITPITHPYHGRGVEGAQDFEVQLAEARVMSEAISEAEAEIAALMSSATQTTQVSVAIVPRGAVRVAVLDIATVNPHS